MKSYLSTISIIAISLIAVCGCSKDSSNDDSPKNGNIKFEDEIAKARLVKLCDLNSDGEISYSEAAAATNADINWANIRYLDELKYFTGITSLMLDDYNSTSLIRFSIPKNVVDIDGIGGREGFNNSSSPKLEKITCYSTNIRLNKRVYYLVGPVGDAKHLFYVPKESVNSYREKYKTWISGIYDETIITDDLNRIKGL